MAWNEKCRRDQCPNVDDALNILKAHSAQHHSRIVSITRVQCFSCATSCKLIPFIICTGAVSQIWSIAIKINNRIEFLDFEFWWAKHREREKMVGLFEEKKTPTIQINILLWLLWFTLAWLRLINQLLDLVYFNWRAVYRAINCVCGDFLICPERYSDSESGKMIVWLYLSGMKISENK